MTRNDESIAGTEQQEDARKLRRAADADAEPKSVTERVLDSAESVLLHQGYAGFSTRRVAQESNIALGNLTYHFPTKAELVRALIDRLMSKYLDYFEDFLRTPGRGVEGLVRWLLEDAPEEDAMRLFREIWAMALHDDIVRQSIDAFYDRLIERVTETLISAHPTADPRAIGDLVHFVAVISEGSSVIYGTSRERATPHHRMVDLVMHMVKAIGGDLDPDGQGKLFAAEAAASGKASTGPYRRPALS